MKTKEDNKMKHTDTKMEVSENKPKEKAKIFNPLKKIANLEEQLFEAKTDHLRALADFENFRARKEKEILQIRDKVIIDFVLEVLPVIDNFELSLKMSDDKKMFIMGVEMIHKNLINTLKEHKFSEFEPKIGEKFDPYLHDPILIKDNSKKPGVIVGVLKKGYKFKDSIVRPARVQVIKDEDLIDKK